jgi:hypothetical protein
MIRLKAKKTLEKADKDGWVEISGGVYLESRETVIDEQKEWVKKPEPQGRRRSGKIGARRTTLLLILPRPRTG